MAEKLGIPKLLLWIGAILMLVWFLIFYLAPAKTLEALGISETPGLFLRLFGIFPLSWAVLFFLALKDVVKNLAIIDGGIITAALLIIAFLVHNFAVAAAKSWFLWLSIIVLFVLNFLLLIFRPKPKAPEAPKL
jgi:hypothetical protein